MLVGGTDLVGGACEEYEGNNWIEESGRFEMDEEKRGEWVMRSTKTRCG